MATELLPCKLTEDEAIVRGEQLAAAIRQEERIARELAYFKEQNKRQATVALYERERLTTIVESHTEYREIEVSEIPDYKRGSVTVVRCDDNTMIRERPMADSEQQPELTVTRGKRAKAEAVEAS